MLDKKQATRILHRMYRTLADDDIRISLRKKIGVHGDVHFNCESGDFAHIRLNPTRRGAGGIISTLLHELLHIIHYDWTEKQVRQTEREMFDALSDRQLTNLVRKSGWYFR